MDNDWDNYLKTNEMVKLILLSKMDSIEVLPVIVVVNFREDHQ